MNYLNILTLPENMIWAWRKAQRLYGMSDGIHNQAELSAFDLNLEENLESIRQDFLRGEYTLEPMKLLPQPKRPDEDGSPKMRQYFEISVRDQVAWIAIINALGPIIDEIIPPWSYGHRLYRNVWYEEPEDSSDEKSKLRRGPYRHANGYMYRKFQHGWPLFRRHVYLTARYMVKGNTPSLDESDKRALLEGKDLVYLDKKFWPQRNTKKLYYASIDLEKFYPNISVDSVLRGFREYVPGLEEDSALYSLLQNMVNFQVEPIDFNHEQANNITPHTIEGEFSSLPTGLWASGFLSNIAMLPVDHEVNELVNKKRNIAHFRYVDDHSILSYDFDDLCNWIHEYENILNKHNIGAPINRNKCDPKELGGILWPSDDVTPEEYSKEKNRLRNECEINGERPTKLMTRTLAQVSTLGTVNFDILTDADKSHRLEQLEWLLLADIPDREIRSDTRVAFAAGRIARLAPQLLAPNEDLINAYRKKCENEGKKKALEKTEGKGKKDEDELAKLSQIIFYYQFQIENLLRKERQIRGDHTRRYFSLLYQAFTEHPEKARLFIRLLGYLQITGYNGFGVIEEWLKEKQSEDWSFTAKYLGSLALQTIARHCLLSAHICASGQYNHSDMSNSRSYLRNVSKINLEVFLGGEVKKLSFFQINAAHAFAAGLLGSACVLDSKKPNDKLVSVLRDCARKILSLNIESPSQDWEDQTGYSLGAWTHLMVSNSFSNEFEALEIWIKGAEGLDPRKKLDWNALRRFPGKLPKSAWKFLAENPVSCLREGDDGWLLDAANGSPENFALLHSIEHRTIETVRHARAIYEAPKKMPLKLWIDFIKTRKPFDPRASEWTALEIVRQLLTPLFLFPNKLDDLDYLHPNNIFIPETWFDKSLDSSHMPLTWEKWKKVAENDKQVDFIDKEVRILDYRIRPQVNIGLDNFDNRLRAIGQLLWFILRKDCSMPSIWNIRGHERSLLYSVSKDFERLAISSFTLSLLESCMTPRSHETMILQSAPNLFGSAADDDTDYDARPIRNYKELLNRIILAQEQLDDFQVTVLHHSPRQLIPVHLRRLGPNAFSDNSEEVLHEP